MNLRTAFKRIDMFGKPIGFNFNGQSTYTTWYGSILSMVAISLVILYTSVQFITMLDYGDSKYMTKLESNDLDRKFTKDVLDIDVVFQVRQFQSFGNRSPQQKSVEDLFELELIQRTYKVNSMPEEKTIPLHKCTEKELI